MNLQKWKIHTRKYGRWINRCCVNWADAKASAFFHRLLMCSQLWEMRNYPLFHIKQSTACDSMYDVIKYMQKKNQILIILCSMIGVIRKNDLDYYWATDFDCNWFSRKNAHVKNCCRYNQLY